MIKVKQDRTTYEYNGSEYDDKPYSEVQGIDEDWDFIYSKLGKIERIKLLKNLNDAMTLNEAKGIINSHVQYVPLPEVYPLEEKPANIVILVKGENFEFNRVIGPFKTYLDAQTYGLDYLIGKFHIPNVNWSWSCIEAPEGL